MKSSHQVLEDIFGYHEFRPGQEQVIHKILNRENVLGLMPTGSGKSICYQLPAVMLDGVAIVISPLISLMKDQVDAAGLLGISATYINSSLTYQEVDQRLAEVHRGQYQLLYVAPERFVMPDFQNMLQHLPLSFIAVDEAHCISQWGHDFRPSYLEMAQTLQQLPQTPVVAALTATATPTVAQDIQQLLVIPSTNTISTGFLRENLHFQVIKDQNKDNYLLEYLRLNQESAGIIYASTRKEVTRVYQLLVDAGIKAAMYHGGLTDQQRAFYQEEFLYDRLTVMVATNAFGMGINKSNVRFVIHDQVPGTMEAYYQEAGRAGRDGLPSDAVLLFAPQDLQVQQFFIEQSEKPHEMKQNEYIKLREMSQYGNTEECLQQYILAYFGQQGVPCGQCSNCLDDRVAVDITVDCQKVLSCLKRMNERFGKGMIAKVLAGSKEQKVKEFHFDQLPTFGIMKERSQKEISQLIDFLVASGYLLQEGGQYPILKLTSTGVQVLKGEVTVYRKEKRQAKQLDDANELFEALRQLRTQLANDESVPAYLIFSDATLKELSEQVPINTLELLQIKGIGRNKLDKYGEAILAVLDDYR